MSEQRSKRETGLAEEAEEQLLVVGCTRGGLVGDDGDLADGLLRSIGKLATLEIRPQAFAGVEVGRVTGEAFDLEPLLGAHEGSHLQAPMAGQPVPDQDHRRPQPSAESAQGGNQDVAGVAAGLGVEVKPGAPAVGAVAEKASRRDPLPVELVAENRGLAARRPGPADGRAQREAGFVLEDEPGSAFKGPFFSSGQRSLTQASTFSGSRSAAHRLGFWRDQPS